jgi:ppGpp synthetase/RelA/SpoT-type nucleotidyltranferase
LIKEEFLEKYHFTENDLVENNLDWDTLSGIYRDFKQYKNLYDTQADFIASTLRSHKKIHFVKSRVKDPEHLIEKVIRKTSDRKKKYGEKFQFTTENYKDEITDLIGVRAIHIFKEEWEDIHKFIVSTWKINEITANVRDGDDIQKFEKLNIQIHSRKSGYRSVHYLIESFPTSEKVVAEIQVRTIFEEGYGEIDHQMRYFHHDDIPEILASNLLLLNRIIGSADEMASMINILDRSLGEMEERYEKVIHNKNREIERLKDIILQTSGMEESYRENILSNIDRIIKDEDTLNIKEDLKRQFEK